MTRQRASRSIQKLRLIANSYKNHWKQVISLIFKMDPKTGIFNVKIEKKLKV